MKSDWGSRRRDFETGASPAILRAGRNMALTGVRVLIVEPDQPLRRLKVHLLRRKGAQVFEAATGRDALALSDVSKFDVVLIKCGLPDVSVSDLVAGIRKKPATAAAQFILVYESVDDLPQPCGEAMLQEPLEADTLSIAILLLSGLASYSEVRGPGAA